MLADPTRRDLLQLLLEVYVSPQSSTGELSVSEIVDRLALTQPTVSKHLKVLRDHGLVSVREEGQHRYYSLDAGPLEVLEDWVVPFLSADFDPSGAGGERSGMSAAFAAWSGADAGHRVGRAVAERSYRVQTAIQDARDQVTRGIHRIAGR